MSTDTAVFTQYKALQRIVIDYGSEIRTLGLRLMLNTKVLNWLE